MMASILTQNLEFWVLLNPNHFCEFKNIYLVESFLLIWKIWYQYHEYLVKNSVHNKCFNIFIIWRTKWPRSSWIFRLRTFPNSKKFKILIMNWVFTKYLWYWYQNFQKSKKSSTIYIFLILQEFLGFKKTQDSKS